MKGCGRKIGPFDCCAVVVGDCLDVMAEMPDGCADLLFADPPYNKGKADWDKGHDWRTWILGAVRVLEPNGAFWAIHRDARELATLSAFVEEEGGPPLVNWVTWDLFNGNETQQALGGPLIGATMPSSLRSFQQMAEYLIYHADDGQWQSQCDRTRGFIFEPLRAYLDGERKRAALTKAEVNRLFDGPNVGQYWWQERNWQLPTRENYEILQRGFNRNNGYEYLRREYESLRREYEGLRPTFNNPGGISSVWQGPIAERSKHPTPKPEWLLERIIKTTSNPDDLVVDFFMGSGTTAVAAQKLGRHFFGCDAEAKYVAMTEKRLSTMQLAMEL